ncbi:MAG: hypothetical protein EOP00_21540 [Pedobacter sp.]|nr:MAG: hypothetical protein EOP00_21540 [Pedobacter sp.]
MKKAVFLIFLSLLISQNVVSQTKQKVFTADISNFWKAFDLIRITKDYSEKIRIINELYIDKGSKGLKAFMQSRNYTDTLYVKQIEDYPKFWSSIRQNALRIEDKVPEIENAIINFRKLYPQLKEAEIYFTIGGMKSGGTIKDNMVLVGCEVATGDRNVDVSELQDDWLKSIFEKEAIDVVALNIHEYVHTQQKSSRQQVLAHSIHEGACDFITELVLGKTLNTRYLVYGKQNAEKVKHDFKREMFTDNFRNWLYNGSFGVEMPDLGYYVGYDICKRYYEQATDKTKAIAEIIELDVANSKEVKAFLNKSGYFEEKINERKLIKAYEANIPFVKSIAPFKNGAKDVPDKLEILKIVFSREMDTKVSINFSKRGKEHFPLKKIIGFESDKKTLLLALDLKAKTNYDFTITDRSTKSADGYMLKTSEFQVTFTTK